MEDLILDMKNCDPVFVGASILYLFFTHQAQLESLKVFNTQQLAIFFMQLIHAVGLLTFKIQIFIGALQMLDGSLDILTLLMGQLQWGQHN